MQIKRMLSGIALCILLLFAFGCRSGPKTYTREFFAMDTVIGITVYSDSEKEAEAAMDSAEKEFFRIGALSDRFSGESEVSRINENAGVGPVSVSEDVFRMIADALSYAERSDGAFDITIGPLMDLWDFKKEENSPPSEAAVKETLLKCGYRKIVLDAENKAVFLTQTGMAIDLGGVAKGYATDCAAAVLKEAGIKSAIINAGGNVCTIGTKPDGEKFRVGIQNPRNGQGILASILLSDKTAVSSGDYQRYYLYQGKRYHHILDPKTGYPAEGTIATTVFSDSAETADILSTTLFVMGAEDGEKLFESIAGVDGALFATEEKTIVVTEGLKDALTVEEGSGFAVS